jgi:hypothetical protein
MKEARLIIGTVFFAIVMIFISGCTESDRQNPISETHPAYGFYQIAKRGPTTLAVCESYGGKEIYPNDYEQLESLGQGVFTLRENSTGKEFLAVAFGEGEIFVTVKTCCWEMRQSVYGK